MGGLNWRLLHIFTSLRLMKDKTTYEKFEYGPSLGDAAHDKPIVDLSGISPYGEFCIPFNEAKKQAFSQSVKSALPLHSQIPLLQQLWGQ